LKRASGLASEQQIAANRRNAKKSTGPKSEAGKKRSKKNALRHGLAVPVSHVESEPMFRDLARQFAGGVTGARIQEQAERAAEGQLELERVRRVRTAMMDCAVLDGKTYHMGKKETRHLFREIDRSAMMPGGTSPHPKTPGTWTPLPEGKEEQERQFAESIRPILSVLSRISRYENRATGRRDKAIRKIAAMARRQDDGTPSI
jgi:hypothetical protein